MRGISYEGKQYRSVRACCQELKISYKKVMELCRLYQRAHRDPALAIAWICGSQPFDPKNEPVTVSMIRHRAKTTLRVKEARFRKSIKAYKRGVDLAFTL